MVQVNNFTGFETEGDEEATGTPVGTAYETTNMRSGGSALSAGTYLDEFRLPWVEGVTDAGTKHICGFAFRFSALQTIASTLFDVWDDSGGRLLRVRLLADETLELYGNGGAIDTSAASFSADTWYYVEIYADLNSASGDWEWFIDGVSEGSGSGADFTAGNAFGSSSSYALTGHFNITDTITYLFDDVYILSGATSADDRLGPGTSVVTYQQSKNEVSEFDRTGAAGGDWLDGIAYFFAFAGDTPLNTSNITAYVGAGTLNGAVAFSGANGNGRAGGPYGVLTNLQTVKASKFHWHARYVDQSDVGSYELIYGKNVVEASTATVSADTQALTTSYADYFKLVESTDPKCPNSSEYAVMGFGKDATGDDLQVAEMWAHTLVVNSNRQLNNFTGFETQGTEEASATSGTPTFETTNHRSGESALTINAVGENFHLPWVAENITDQGSRYIIGFAFRKTGNPSGDIGLITVFDDSAGVILAINLNTSGQMILRSAVPGTLDTSSALDNDRYYFIEVYADLNSASGDWEWFIDDISEGSGTGADLTDGNVFGSSSSGISLGGGTDITSLWDDIYILSGCNGPEDRLGDFEVFGHQNGETDAEVTPHYDETGATPGDDLNTAGWGDISTTPADAGGQAIYSGGAQAGLVLSDTSNASGLGPGPLDDTNSYYDGDANIKARKGIWNAERGSGSGTTHTLYLAQSIAAGTAATGVASRAVTLTTGAADFELLDTTAPLSTEDIAQGFGKSTGGREFEANEMWVMIAHVPTPEVGITFVNLDTAAIDAVASVTSSISMNWGINSTIAGAGDITSALNRRMIIDAAIATTTAVTPALDAQPGLRSALAASTSITSSISVIKMLDAVTAATSSVAAALDAQSGLYSSIDATTAVTSTLNNQRILDASVAALGDVVSSLSRGMILDSAVPATTSVAADLDAQPGLYSTIAALSSVTSELGITKDLNAAIAATGALLSSLSMNWGLDSTVVAVTDILATLDAQSGLYSSIAAATALASEISLTQSLDSVISGSSALAVELNRLKNISSTIAATGTLLSSLSLSLSLAASIGATTSLTSSLAVAKSLDSAIAGLGAIAASMDSQSGLYSSIDGTGDIVSSLSMTWGLDSTIAGSADILSALDAQSGLYSSVAATSAVASALDAQSGLYAAINAVSDIVSELDIIVAGVTFVNLDGTIAGSAAITSSLSVLWALNSIIATTGDISSALAATKTIGAVIAATGAVSSSLDPQSGLYSSISVSSAIAAALAADKSLDVNIAAITTLAAAVDAQPGLYASLAASSDILVSLNSIRSLDSLIAAVGSVDGQIGAVVNIDGTILGTSTVVGAASLLRSLDSLITGTSSVDAEMNKLVGFSVVIAGAVTIAGEIIGEAPDFRGFVFPANAEQYHLTSANAEQYHSSTDDAEQYHSSTQDVSQYHSLIKDISQYHLGVANEFN